MKQERITGRALQTIIRRIARRDQGLCQNCLPQGFVIPGTQVDHRVALDNGGTEDDANRWLLCTACHRIKTMADKGNKPKGADLDGWPTDPRHPWNAKR